VLQRAAAEHAVVVVAAADDGWLTRWRCDSKQRDFRLGPVVDEFCWGWKKRRNRGRCCWSVVVDVGGVVGDVGGVVVGDVVVVKDRSCFSKARLKRKRHALH